MASTDLWNELAKREPSEVAARAGVTVGGAGGYEVPVLNGVYRVDVHTGSMTAVESGKPTEPDRHLSLATVMYLSGAKDVDPTGEWVSPRDLPGGERFFSGPHEIPVVQIVERFGGDSGSFLAACRSLGGQPEPYADAACSFPLFPRLPVAVLLWLGDDEFAARATMLVDRTAKLHLPLDALLAALNVMQTAVLAAASCPTGADPDSSPS